LSYVPEASPITLSDRQLRSFHGGCGGGFCVPLGVLGVCITSRIGRIAAPPWRNPVVVEGEDGGVGDFHQRVETGPASG